MSRHPMWLPKVARPVREPEPSAERARSPAPRSAAALVQRALLLPASMSPGEVQQLHRVLGNRRVGQLMLGPRGDRHEQEADRVAQRVMEGLDADAGPAVGRAVRHRADDGEGPPREFVTKGSVASRRPWPWLGLYTLSLAGVRGAVVRAVTVVGPAHEAGILPGDVIVELNGERIGSAEHFDLYQLLWRGSVEQEVEVVVQRERGLESVRFSARLRDRPP